MVTAKKTTKKTPNKYSPNNKLNYVLKDIHNDLNYLGRDEVDNSKKLFPREIDYNLVQHGNMKVYYDDIRRMYKKAGYKNVDSWSNQRLWDTYRR